MKKSLSLAAFTALALTMTVPAHAAGPQAQTSAATSQSAQIQIRERAPAEEKGFFGRMGDSIGNVFSSDDEASAPASAQAETNTNARANTNARFSNNVTPRTASRHYDAVGGVLVEGRGNAPSQRTANGSVGNKATVKAGTDANSIAPAAGANIGVNTNINARARANADSSQAPGNE